jgi:NAD(P)-dependent dehydrogenase (short-subunit alcohol dehydrogenase family)
MSNPQKTALVTGAFEGTGSFIAKTLLKAGYRVYGTSRSAQAADGGVQPLQLDLRDPTSITACVAHVQEDAGGIDLMVSNAAITIVAPGEELPLDRAEEMMQINFFGVVRLVNALLPGMRDQGGGHLIFVSSLAGKMGIPGQGHYCSTKHALEGYVDGLAPEVKGFGIKATLLQPGSIKTEMIEKSPQPDWPTLTAYDGVRDHLRITIEANTRKGCDPQEIADFVLKAARARSPRLRYRTGSEGRQAMFMKSILPEQVFYPFLANRFGL